MKLSDRIKRMKGLHRLGSRSDYRGTKFFSLDGIRAHRKLNPFVGPWVFHNDGAAKRQLMSTYHALPERQKAALAFEVAEAMSGPTVVYRWLKEGDAPTKMGGASVTDDPTAFGYGSTVHAFRASPDDVMLHYAQKDSWLHSRRYGHEHEMILKPDARPQHLGPLNTETKILQRWPGKKQGSANEKLFVFSGLTCPAASSELVNWSTGSWFYPTPTEALDWATFRDAVRPTAEEVQESGFLGWQKGWEPFGQFLKGQWVNYPSGRVREPGGGTHAWYRGALPSGMPFYVWVGSGIEHWWVPRGSYIDVETETQIVQAAEERLDGMDAPTLADVVRVVSQIRG